jgi:hypothetical protein
MGDDRQREVDEPKEEMEHLRLKHERDDLTMTGLMVVALATGVGMAIGGYIGASAGLIGSIVWVAWKWQQKALG